MFFAVLGKVSIRTASFALLARVAERYDGEYGDGLSGCDGDERGAHALTSNPCCGY